MDSTPLDLTDTAAIQGAVADLAATLGRLHREAYANTQPLALHPATHLAGLSLWEVICFLERLPGFAASGNLGSIRSLLAAVADLESGTPSPMLQKAKGKNPMATEMQILMAMAAVALDVLIRSGMSTELAVKRVGREMERAKVRLPQQYKARLPDTVKGWRNRLVADKNAPPLAAKAWRFYTQELSSRRAMALEIDPECIPEILANLRGYISECCFLTPP